MDLIIGIAVVAAVLLLLEMLLPTGGVLAIIGALGLIAAGVIAFGDDGEYADYAGGGLVTLGVLSIATFFIITPKVLRAQVDNPVRGGIEQFVGMDAEVREQLNPVGSIWVEGAIWKARIADGGAPQAVGSRVRIDSVDGLTLIVSPYETAAADQA